MRTGELFIVAAPSGAGKTSLVRALVEKLEGIHISISHTTRPPRPSEKEGVDYFFVSESSFQKMIEDNEFLEHATIYHHRYGTSRRWVLQQLQQGQDVILEIDWQGARQIMGLFPQAQSIYILPPSLDTLYQRLQTRSMDTQEIIHQRMLGAREEIQHFHEFDYLILNQSFSTALEDLMHIVCARRLRIEGQAQDLNNMLKNLLG